MDPNANGIQTGTITILRGPFPPNCHLLHNIRPATRGEASEIIDYSVKSKDNQNRETTTVPNVPPQQATSAPKATVIPIPGKKRPRLLMVDPVEQALMTAEHQRMNALRVKEYEKRNFWLMNDEDVTFFNSVLPHVRALSARQKLRFRIHVLQILDEGVPDSDGDDTPPQSPTTSQQEVCGFYCGNCGHKFLFNHD